MRSLLRLTMLGLLAGCLPAAALAVRAADPAAVVVPASQGLRAGVHKDGWMFLEAAPRQGLRQVASWSRRGRDLNHAGGKARLVFPKFEWRNLLAAGQRDPGGEELDVAVVGEGFARRAAAAADLPVEQPQ